VCSPDDTTWGTGGTRTFTESIESVVRNVVQQQKIEMADEVINAGRFDQQTSHAERRETLEKLMQEQSTAGTRSCASMSLKTLNARLARTPAEVELFNEMDLQADLWPGGLTVADETPSWIRYEKAARDEAVSSQATRTKPGLAGEREEAEKARAIELASGVELGRGARNRGGFVPGSYAAADRALTGEDARAVQLRAMKKAAEDKATTGGKAATAEVKAASTVTAPDATVPTATTEVKVQTPEGPANAAEEVGMLEDDVLSEVTETENEALVEAGEEVGMDPAELSEEDEEYHKGEDEELAGIEEIGAHIDEDEDDLPPSPKFDHPPAAANDGPAPMDTDDAPAAPAAAKKLTFTFGKKK
jgi:SWI/SNF-related matrix-associated actin-dependent regulator of chromatin subfamily A protein 2/4